MNKFYKRRVIFFTLLLFFSTNLSAQQDRFLYMQTENQQPFYVKLDKKILSSSASGHIIVSKLVDSIYTFYFGFPKNEWPQQNVTVSLKAANAGFLLKNLGEKGWGLLNLQTMQLLKGNVEAKDKIIVETEAGDEFARVLAEVVNDPSIGRVSKIKIETPATEEINNKTEAAKTDTATVIKTVSSQSRAEAVTAKVEISKLRFDSTAEGITLTYVDQIYADTVNILFPIRTTERKIQSEKQGTVKITDEKKNKDSRFIDMELPNPNQKIDSVLNNSGGIVINEKKTELKKTPESSQDSIVKPADTRRMMINSDCKKTATDKDFRKLRKQMTGEDEYKLMIKAANKQFIITCFTTEQIKNLGFLFLKEEERYKFFVAAFPFVADTHNYASLQDQLTDNYYIVRFKAMVNH